MLRNLLIYLSGLIFLISCEEDKVYNETVLADFLELNGVSEPLNLIACAGGKEEGLMPGDVFENSIFFYPIPGAENFKCFVSTNNPDQLVYYREIELPLDSLFHGYMLRYLAGSELNKSWVRVCYTTKEGVHLSNPITMKTDLKPTQISSDITNTTNATKGQTKLTWQDGLYDDNEIYFEVFADNEENFMSGTYTYEKVFYYYDLENVVLNVTREQAPVLIEGNDYTVMIMGVSIDNWVNNIWQSTISY